MLPAPASKRKFRNTVAFCAGTVVISFLITPFLGINILVFFSPKTSQIFAETPYLELSKAVCVA